MSENEQRAHRAHQAIMYYQREVLDGDPLTDPNELQELLTDLLTDLRHWAAHSGLDMRCAVEVSENHFQQEAQP